jgi:hypothetical protein
MLSLLASVRPGLLLLPFVCSCVASFLPFSTPNMKTALSSETSVNIYGTTRIQISEKSYVWCMSITDASQLERRSMDIVNAME